MIKPAWWSQHVTPSAFKGCVWVVLSTGWTFGGGEMGGSMAGEQHYSSREWERECGTGSPERRFDLVPVARTVCG